MSLGFVRHKLSIDKYERMIRAGILTENDRVELIRGELLDKTPIGKAHVEAVNRRTRKFAKLLDEAVTVSVQNPLVLADREPEPDLTLYTRRSGGKPRPADVHLVVEVADSSLEFDRQPQLDGSYADSLSLQTGDVIEPLAFPGVCLTVSEILPHLR